LWQFLLTKAPSDWSFADRASDVKKRDRIQPGLGDSIQSPHETWTGHGQEHPGLASCPGPTTGHEGGGELIGGSYRAKPPVSESLKQLEYL
jgi:hypothetical protein